MVTVTAKDKDNASKSITFTVSANAAPTEIQLSNAKLVEQQPIGSFIGKFSSTDSDAGNTFSYTLVSGSGDADNQSFAILGDELRAGQVFSVSQDTDFSIRVRSTDQDLLSIERTVLVRVTKAGAINTNFGDAPTAAQSGFSSSYPTSLESNGARHSLGSLRLGAASDAEPNGIGSINALGDDTTGVDDEDGIQYATPIFVSPGAINRASIVVAASGAGKLDGWIDFNRAGRTS